MALSKLYGKNLQLFQCACIFIYFVSTVFFFFSAPWTVPETSLYAHECEIFGLLVARVVQKVYDNTGLFFVQFFKAIRWIANHADWFRHNKMFQTFVRGCDRAVHNMLKKATHMPPSLPWSGPKVDFCKALYINEQSPAWIDHFWRELFVGKGRK